MRKLKLESLNVESFDTTAAPSSSRGTVQGNDQVGTTGLSLCQVTGNWRCRTDDAEVCGATNYLDCTLGCTDFESCQGGC